MLCWWLCTLLRNRTPRGQEEHLCSSSLSPRFTKRMYKVSYQSPSTHLQTIIHQFVNSSIRRSLRPSIHSGPSVRLPAHLPPATCPPSHSPVQPSTSTRVALFLAHQHTHRALLMHSFLPICSSAHVFTSCCPSTYSSVYLSVHSCTRPSGRPLSVRLFILHRVHILLTVRPPMYPSGSPPVFHSVSSDQFVRLPVCPSIYSHRSARHGLPIHVLPETCPPSHPPIQRSPSVRPAVPFLAYPSKAIHNIYMHQTVWPVIGSSVQSRQSNCRPVRPSSSSVLFRLCLRRLCVSVPATRAPPGSCLSSRP